MSFNQHNELLKNLEIFKIIIKYDLEMVLPSEDEISLINEFKGFGGIKSILFPLNREWADLSNISSKDLKDEMQVKELYQLIIDNYGEIKGERLFNELKESVLTSFYTPKEVVDVFFENLHQNNTEINSFLDPSAGAGVYVDSCLKVFPNCKITAVEINYFTALILKTKYHNNSNITVVNKGFEKIDFKSKFDVIASNIPFGDYNILDNKYPKEATKAIHTYFFYKSCDLLKNNGILNFITSSGVFNSDSNRDLRVYLANNGIIKDLFVLPNNLFINNGTEVTSHLISFQKKNVIDNSISLWNNSFMDTIKKDNLPKVNSFINQYHKIVYLEQNPILSTNPYGQPEYNYTLSLEKVVEVLKTNLFIPKLLLEQNNIEVGIDSNKESLRLSEQPSFKIESGEYTKEDELDFFYSENQKISRDQYKILAFINARYYGKNITIGAISKSYDLENEKVVYKIDNLIKNYNHLFVGHINDYLIGRDFKSNFDNYLNSLEKLVNELQLEISVSHINSIDGENFQDFFYQKFKQPSLNKYYYTHLNHFKFHQDKIDGLLYFDKVNDRVVTINGKIEIDNYEVFETDAVSFEDELEEDIVKEFLTLYNVFSEFLELDSETRKIAKSSFLEHSLVDSWERKRGLLKTLHLDFINKYNSVSDNLIILNNYNITVQSDIVSSILETNFENKFIPSDFINTELPIVTISDNLSITEAIIKSFNYYGIIDINWVGKITGKNIEEIISESEELIIFNPLNDLYEFRQLFLSGDIYLKIEQLNSLDKTESVLIALNELEQVKPSIISYPNISKQFGARWIPVDIMNEFVNDYYQSRFSLIFNQATDNIAVVLNEEGVGYKSYKTIGNRNIEPQHIIENAFYNTYPIVTYSVEEEGGRRTYTDEKATEYYRREITRLRNSFENYLIGIDENLKKSLELTYNRLFNNIVLPELDGDLLSFDDMDLEAYGVPSMYEHQKNAVFHTVLNEGGIVDHEVGFGKTLTMVAQARTLKKLKIANKPIITALKTNVADIANAYKTIYPQSNILFASEKDYSVANRADFLNKIKMFDWDVIVMSHEQFGKIPQSDEKAKDLIEIELSHIEQNLDTLTKGDATKRQLSGLYKAKKSLESRLNSIIERIENNKDKNVLSFESLGIDHIIIDESHKYKNLAFQTRHTRVAGLGQTEGNQSTTNLLIALRTIQDNTKNHQFGATFYSGTPISNSLTELYSLQKYLVYDDLVKKGIQNFDSWASVFSLKTSDFETNIVGNIVSKERFRYFVNMPELALMYKKMAHVMNGDMTKVDRPNKNEFALESKLLPSQERFFSKLSKFLDNGDIEALKLDKPPKIDDNNSSKSLIATNLAMKASLDMRLLRSSEIDDPNSKINILVKNVLEVYNKFDLYKGTQIIFSDLVGDRSKKSFEELQDNYNNKIFTGVYDDLKFKLIKAGINSEEIAFIHDWDKKKHILSNKMNEGKIRILIGGTQNAGTGLNVQERLSNIWHLTIPWKPTELTQRNGRGYRKGNELCKYYNDNKVDLGICATQKTLDPYKIDLLKNKDKFINQIRVASNSNSRIADEGSMDEDNGLSLAELQAQLTGDNSLLEKGKIENKIKNLESEKHSVLVELDKSKRRIEQNNNRIEELQNINNSYNTVLNNYQSNVKYDENNNRINVAVFEGYSINLDNSKEQQEEKWIKYITDIKVKAQLYHHNDYLKFGELFGCDIVAKNTFFEGVVFGVLNNNIKPAVFLTYGDGNLNKEKEFSANYFLRCFDYLENKFNKNEKEINHLLFNNSQLNNSLNLTFNKEEELLNLKEELLSIEKIIKDSVGNGNNSSVDRINLIGFNKELSVNKITGLQHLRNLALNDNLLNRNESSDYFIVDNNVYNFINFISNIEGSSLHIIDEEQIDDDWIIYLKGNNLDDIFYDISVLYNHHENVIDKINISENLKRENIDVTLVLFEQNGKYYSYGKDTDILNDEALIDSLEEGIFRIVELDDNDLDNINHCDFSNTILIYDLENQKISLLEENFIKDMTRKM